MISISDLKSGQLVKITLDNETIIGEVKTIYRTLLFGADYFVMTIRLKNGELRKVHQSEIQSIETIRQNKRVSEDQFYSVSGEIIAEVSDGRADIEALLVLFSAALAAELFGENSEVEDISVN
ncbi:hypothetical protein [Peptostreptococcus sp.]|uniref:hypothetical protein n=1 Tax=Peptostreptococcus sp. TaxID=1262 RepID=UPI001DFCCA7B|nr:hypothetical protein [Peptostreptococcus sp.]MBS5596863.1 hypothetical protein [Peptostreptococcus sp.]